MKSNVMRMPTWSYLKLNGVDLSKKDFKKKKYHYVKSDLSYSDDVKDIFSKKEYGLSEEKLNENENLRNVSLYRQVDKDLKTEIINFDFDKDNDRVINSLDIKAKENTKSSFLLTYNSKDVDCYLNSLIRVHLGKNSKVKLVIVVNLENKSHNYQQIASIIEEDANLEISYIELGSSKSFVNFKNFLDGKRSQLDFDGVYFKENEDYLDLLVTNEHNGVESNSDTIFYGALKDKANKAWKGVVDLKRGSKSADGKIGDYAVCLSDDVVNKTAPVLLCEEDDVKGNHAASVGRLDQNMLYYIMSRGLSKKEAESMILEANFTPTLDKVEDEKLRDYLKQKVHRMNVRGL